MRIPDYDYAQAGYYFVTICTQNRRDVLSIIRETKDGADVYLTPIGRLIEEQLMELHTRWDVEIGHYVIMPNHIHFVMCNNRSSEVALGKVIAVFKSITTRLANRRCYTTGQKLWQRGYYEHIIRNDQEYREILQYISNNPLSSLLKKE